MLASPSKSLWRPLLDPVLCEHQAVQYLVSCNLRSTSRSLVGRMLLPRTRAIATLLHQRELVHIGTSYWGLEVAVQACLHRGVSFWAEIVCVSQKIERIRLEIHAIVDNFSLFED